MISSQMQTIIDMFFAGKAAGGRVELTREMIPMARQDADQSVIDNRTYEDITTENVEIGGQRGEFYRLDENDPMKRNNCIFYYIHGGAFETGTVKSRRFTVQSIVRNAKMDGFSIDYVQWPEGMFPEGLMNCLDAYRGLMGMGYKPENIYIGGESAGAVLTLQLVKYLKEHYYPLPGKIVAMGPVLDFSIVNHYASRVVREERDPMLFGKIKVHYFSDKDRESEYVALWKNNFKGFPPTMITVGTEEVLYDDAIDLHEKMDAAGVFNVLKIYDGLFHCFQLFDTPESVAALEDIGEFLK